LEFIDPTKQDFIFVSVLFSFVLHEGWIFS
jgi:hypothetical protein